MMSFSYLHLDGVGYIFFAYFVTKMRYSEGSIEWEKHTV